MYFETLHNDEIKRVLSIKKIKFQIFNSAYGRAEGADPLAPLCSAWLYPFLDALASLDSKL